MNELPTGDGDVRVFVDPEASGSTYFRPGHSVIFINGIKNSPEDHRKSAKALSLLQMCRVIGVYNLTDSLIKDLVQCLGDKYQFDGPLARDPAAALDDVMDKLASEGRRLSRADAMAQALERNPACLAMFHQLRRKDLRRCPVMAHSQGNLILSNALSAVAAVDGAEIICGREVHSFGSPSLNWPRGIRHQEYGFTFDPVTWLAGFDTSFRISKVGVPRTGDLAVLSHSFTSYMTDDPAFVINRFRWGGWGVTFSLDEKGLAQALVAMDSNLPRVKSIFERLRKCHSTDSDDVARYYLNEVKGNPRLLGLIRQNSSFCRLLQDILKSGWVSQADKTALALIA